jgi:tetratricopeptide (TPR) repeat protein
LALAFSPDGKELAAVMFNQSVYIFDATNGHPKQVLKLNTGGAGTRALGFSPDGRLLATAGDRGTVKIWDLEAGRLRGALQGHTSGIYCLAFSPDGGTLVTGDNDFAVRLWDTITYQERMTLGGLNARITAVAFSPDGNTLAAASRDGFARIWRASLEPEARTFDNRPAEGEGSAIDAPGLANLLDRYAQDLRATGDFIGAESSARQCLVLREKNMPDDWRSFDSQSFLGGCLLDQKKYAEAEPLLLSGYAGLKQRSDAVLADVEPHLQEALARLVQLDEATGRTNQVAGWKSEAAGWDRKTLERLRSAAKQGDLQSLNDLAWFLSTAGNAGIRDGTGAVMIAEKIVAENGRKKSAFLDTLGAAYAETGQFTNAVSVEKEAIGLETDERVKEGLARRLQLYEANSPYHAQE